MYEESVAVPLIVSGPGVPAGVVSTDPVSLVDAYPTILDALGVPLTDDERQLPGRSLWPIAAGHALHRAVFSEYHAVASTTASYMLRSGRFKLVFYVGYPPQLFDLAADPDECRDLAALTEYRPVVTAMERQLRDLLDPEATDARAKADQRALVSRHGGRDAVLAKGSFVNSPVPGETPTYRPGHD
jgi:choline-sulfatase